MIKSLQSLAQNVHCEIEMKKMLLIRILTLSLAMTLVGCGTITAQSNLNQPTATRLSASVGSTIFRLDRISDLPNAFGKADVFGGKVDRGYAELKFLGVNEQGELVLSVVDINRNSSETTMDRYGNTPRIQVQSNVSVGGSSAEPVTKFVFDFKKESELFIAGVRVKFVDVKPYSVTYVLNSQ